VETLITTPRSARPGRIALSALALAAAVATGLGFGHWAANRNQSQAADGQQSTDREVSKKTWFTAQQIKDRFSPAKHEEFMRKAIANSREAGVEKRTGGAFGAVIVDLDGKIVAEGSNHVVSNFDPTWHGEMEAIRKACARLKVLKLEGCILYTSSEPCPMCLATSYWAGVDGIVFGAGVADAKKYGGFDDEFLYNQFASPASARMMPQIRILPEEAVKVWKEYAAQPGNVPY
jgi:guanine deaminase